LDLTCELISRQRWGGAGKYGKLPLKHDPARSRTILPQIPSVQKRYRDRRSGRQAKVGALSAAFNPSAQGVKP